MNQCHAAIWRLSTLLHISLFLAACRAPERAQADSGSASTPGKTTDSSFRVGLLTPGPISDKSWNAGAYAGLLRVRDSLGALVSHVQTRTPAEFDENFRQYGSQRYALVFGHGFEYQDAARRVAPQFPKTVYALVSATAVGPNIA